MRILSGLFAVFMMVSANAAWAQEAAKPAGPAASSAADAAAVVPAAPVALTKEEMEKPFRGSFFLSPLEIEAIQEALNGHLVSGQTLGVPDKTALARRVIRIGGVIYRSPDDWVVWMNNKKVTPKDLLPEIIDISVRDTSKVSLKWYDVGLNKVILITLRPHQMYDIATGVLLPGTQLP